MREFYDNTRLSTYKECPRKYLLRHILGWTVDYGKKAPALVFGSAWHAGMDALWGLSDLAPSKRVEGAMVAFLDQWESDGYSRQPTMEEADDLGQRTPGNAHEMYHGYAIARERMLREAHVISIEQPIAMPIPLLDDCWYIGKLDKVVEYNGLHILEHKTTSMYAIKGNFQPDYVESWSCAPQVKGYQVLGSVFHPGLQDVWVDAALVHKKVHDAFKFIPVAHTQEILQEWVVDTRRWVQEIQREEQEFRLIGDLSEGNFRKNEDQCFGKYSKCPFLNICGVCADPTVLPEVPHGYKVERWEPFDTLKLSGIIEKVSE